MEKATWSSLRVGDVGSPRHTRRRISSRNQRCLRSQLVVLGGCSKAIATRPPPRGTALWLGWPGSVANKGTRRTTVAMPGGDDAGIEGRC